MTAMNESLIRQDRLGRMRFSREQREALLDAYEASGLTGPQFAALHGVAYQTFATWSQKRRKQSSSPAFPLTLAEVEHSPDSVPEAPSIDLSLPGGATMRLSVSSQLPLAAALIRELSRPC